MSIYKEHLPAINNCRASPNFEGSNFNYTENSNKTQAQIVIAFSSSFHKYIVIFVLGSDDKRVVIYWTAISLNQKVRKLGLIWNKLQSKWYQPW